MKKEPLSLSTPSQPRTLTLEEVAAHFEHWRMENPATAEPAGGSLRESAAGQSRRHHKTT